MSRQQEVVAILLGALALVYIATRMTYQLTILLGGSWCAGLLSLVVSLTVTQILGVAMAEGVIVRYSGKAPEKHWWSKAMRQAVRDVLRRSR